jgi:hypothetical protein
VATEAAWLKGKKREELMEKSKTLLTGTGLLMEGVGPCSCSIEDEEFS